MSKSKQLLDSFHLEGKITEQHAKEIEEIITTTVRNLFRDYYIKDNMPEIDKTKVGITSEDFIRLLTE